MGVRIVASAGEDGAFKASPGRHRTIHRAVEADRLEFMDGWKRGTVREGNGFRSITVKARSHGRTIDLPADAWRSFVPSEAKDD